MEELPIYSGQAIFYAFLGILTLVVAWFAGRISAQRPLSAFNQAVDRWRQGDLQTRVKVFNPHTPIGHLSVAFNDMATKLSLREAERESVLRVLREGEERLQIAQDVAGLGIWDWNHLTGEISWSAQMFQLAGLDHETANANLSQVWRELIHPDDKAWMEQEVRRFSRTLDPLAAEYRIVREDGSTRWLLMRGQSLPDETGKPVRTVIVNLDITSSKDSEVRERFLLSLSDKIRDLERPDEILMTVAEALGKHLGVDRVGYGDVDDTTMVLSTLVDWHADDLPDVPGRHPLRAFGPVLCADLKSGRTSVFDDALSDSRAEGHYAAYAALDCIASIFVPLVKEGQIRAALYIHSGTPRRWTQAEIDLSRDTAERTWAAVERAKSDARQRLLINELNHRVKNTLATVQSIAAQSFKADEPRMAREAFEARLFALSKTHDVLTRENWERVNLRDIAEEAMAPYRREQVERFIIEGPALHVPPRIALPLAMVLHELSTNAVKYGAFSVDSGRVTIHWDLVEGWDEKGLVLHWQEEGGPPVKIPTRKGFGSRLIERSLSRELSGKVVLDYRPSGLLCTISLPLPVAHESVRRAVSFG
ncbi:HWE histidine kinase domain-containing protein [Microvirga puerhi]|uniref:Blue-light-activated histidine kinase n=1 Tax=Microvirga puerhi TaxID=2876078 RepID=A0ABS7VSL0_9HYPH|nr:HWE histidine kinase domain-containing protein [Microvirga puerhi]MBZ6078530.1 PAS domain-containing protein [Microvirga puerhi]